MLILVVNDNKMFQIWNTKGNPLSCLSSACGLPKPFHLQHVLAFGLRLSKSVCKPQLVS